MYKRTNVIARKIAKEIMGFMPPELGECWTQLCRDRRTKKTEVFFAYSYGWSRGNGDHLHGVADACSIKGVQELCRGWLAGFCFLVLFQLFALLSLGKAPIIYMRWVTYAFAHTSYNAKNTFLARGFQLPKYHDGGDIHTQRELAYHQPQCKRIHTCTRSTTYMRTAYLLCTSPASFRLIT